MNFLRQPLNCYFQNCMCIRPARSSDKIFKITRYANASAHLSLLLKLPSDKRILSDRCLQSFPLLSAENSYLIEHSYMQVLHYFPPTSLTLSVLPCTQFANVVPCFQWHREKMTSCIFLRKKLLKSVLNSSISFNSKDFNNRFDFTVNTGYNDTPFRIKHNLLNSFTMVLFCFFFFPITN